MHLRAPNGQPPQDRNDLLNFSIVVAGTLLTMAFAFVLAYLLRVPLTGLFAFRWESALVGFVATGPLFVLLTWFMRSQLRPVVEFRRSQLEFLNELGFRLTPARIALIALGAGVSEEFLFRGVLQGWMAGHAPLWLAILAPNILFGLLHARTTLYAISAGAVGIYFGLLYWATGNLWAPIIAHAVYDFVALDIARRMLAAR